MKKIIYVLGNQVVDIDRIPLKLLPKLQDLCPQFDFVRLDPTEEIQIDETRELILIDSVIGIDKVTVFHDLNYLSLSPRVTVHDYDLPINLGLLQKLDKVKKITIIGIPAVGEVNRILNEVIDTVYIHLTFKK